LSWDEVLSKNINRSLDFINTFSVKHKMLNDFNRSFPDCTQHHHLVRPEDVQLHDRQREGVWRQLLGHHLRTDLESPGLVRVRPLLGLGHEGAHHPALRNLLECFHHVGTHWGNFIDKLEYHVLFQCIDCAELG